MGDDWKLYMAAAAESRQV